MASNDKKDDVILQMVATQVVGSPRWRVYWSDLPPELKTFLIGLLSVNVAFIGSNYHNLDNLYGSWLPYVTSFLPLILSGVTTWITNTRRTVVPPKFDPVNNGARIAALDAIEYGAKVMPTPLPIVDALKDRQQGKNWPQ